ncbi:hypothetical protein PR202_ga19741 [Eleusine coracana subsp. coracana]|uniref:Uncharacterized protein n=1 Tax=Eleusine coracana subsp. coracana TaxID=191504 RepID=A0AAV5CX73_ELECO|nr:hypothetical protein PR202_ga19741 [Eleusine coracana subsp. coracana]
MAPAAGSSSSSIAILLILKLGVLASLAAAAMDPIERETLFRVMESVSSDRDWRSAAGADPCASPWPGLECKPSSSSSSQSQAGRPTTTTTMHVARLDFGNPDAGDPFTLPPAANLSSSRLQQLSVRANPSLSGTLPPQLASLRSLQVLTVSPSRRTRWSVASPAGVADLAGLVHLLDLSYNSLTGPIPTRLGELRGLVGLDLSYNSFSGPIPTRLGDLKQLQKLDLSSNNLTGAVPASLTGLKSLTFLALSNNGLRGRLPAGLSDLPRPAELRLANSGYSGSIPDTFGNLASLTTLSLENNNLTGRIPAGLTRLKRMYHLNLSKNGLDGVVPFDGAFLKQLGRNLDLSGNPGLCVVADRAAVVCPTSASESAPAAAAAPMRRARARQAAAGDRHSLSFAGGEQPDRTLMGTWTAAISIATAAVVSPAGRGRGRGPATVRCSSSASVERQVLFSRIAPVYDHLNDVLSLGQHRTWKRICVSWSRTQMTQVMAVDFSRQQLYTAAERQEQRWKLCYKNIKWIEGDALQLPFTDCYFDAVTVGYGLRNVVDKPKAMQEIFRVLKPGSTASILDFNKSSSLFTTSLQSWMIDNVVVPLASGYGLAEEYKYLKSSISQYLTGEELEKLAIEAGFSQAKHYELGGGLMGNLVVTRDALSVAVTKGLNTWPNNQRDLNIITSALPKADNEMKCSTDHARMLF